MYLPCFCFFDLQQPYYTNLLMEKSLVKENSCQRYHFAKAPIQSSSFFLLSEGFL
ncbi:hypothetical protein Chls_957 [Chlamydia suis]|uniref:Uncharacterized protein n=1 Tax=Chlamydia suis TaxID=83559 RepID=A0ABX6IUV4_9CHLA|nr:hypothetical protein Chls_957 [Chlamydia suis]